MGFPTYLPGKSFPAVREAGCVKSVVGVRIERTPDAKNGFFDFGVLPQRTPTTLGKEPGFNQYLTKRGYVIPTEKLQRNLGRYQGDVLRFDRIVKGENDKVKPRG